MFLDAIRSAVPKREAQGAAAWGTWSEADACCPESWRYMTAESRFNVVWCSRRAGKTASKVRKHARRGMLKPNSRWLYITMIRDNAWKYYWEQLKRVLTEKRVRFDSNEARMMLTLENGAFFQATSADDIADVGKKKGDEWDGVGVDEAQDFPVKVLSTLIDVAIFPSLGNRGGFLDISGTPPPVQHGYFYDLIKSKRFTEFRWTMFDNKFYPNAQEEYELALSTRGLTPDHPIVRSEYFGELVTNPEALVWEYDPQRNHMDEVDTSDRGAWRFTMGIDLGFQDRDAIVVLGWRKDDPEKRLFVVEQWQQNHLDVDQLSAVVLPLYHKWKPVHVVGDHGGHGAVKVLETIANRLGIIMGRKPGDLLVSIGLVNDDFRAGRLKVPPGSPVATDARLETWDQASTKKEVDKGGYHSDIMAALRYAHEGARHYQAKAPKPEPTREEKRIQWENKKRQQMLNPWGL